MKLWHLGIVSTLVLFLTACAQQQAEPAAHPETADKPLSQMDSAPPVTDPYANDPYASGGGGMAKPQDTGAKPAGKETKLISGKNAPGGRTHVVAKGDTLYSLARQYYHDQSKWKVIWEANKGSIPNKDKLVVGTKLIIP
jgi:5'-nucleotidase / UDP-sugar diphosphatase